jgi:effector-binding domain-containing protein
MIHNVHYQTLRIRLDRPDGGPWLRFATWIRASPAGMLTPMRSIPLLLMCALTLAACAGRASIRTEPGGEARFTPDLPISRPPFNEVHADWKERLPRNYVYVEHVGSYTETGRMLPGLYAALKAAGIEPSGPPFGLFYDDPGQVPVDRLLSRACFPVKVAPAREAGLKVDLLPGTTVVYAIVSGPYPDVPRAYPGVFEFVRKMGWRVNGPVLESYLTPPETVDDFADLLAEIQVPVAEAP